MRSILALFTPIVIIVLIVVAGRSAISSTVDGVSYANGNGAHLPAYSAILERQSQLDIQLEKMQRKHYPERFFD